MNDADQPVTSQQPPDTLCFTYPPEAWRFRMFCGIVFVILLGAGYLPYVSTASQAGWVAGSCLIALAMVIAVLGDSAGWLKLRRPIEVTSEGITKGGRSVTWDDFRGITVDGSFARIHLKRGLRWTSVLIVGYPFTYQLVIPAILRNRPGLPLSKGIQKRLADPAYHSRVRRWSALLVFACQLTLMIAILLPEFFGLNSVHMFLATFVLIGLSCLAAIFREFTISGRSGFVRAAILCPGISGLGAFCHFAAESPQAHVHATMAAGLAIVLLGILVAVTSAPLRKWHLTAITCLLIATPVGVGALGRVRNWPGKDITHALPSTTYEVIWGHSGTLLAPRDNPQYIVSFPSLKRLPVPQFPEYSSIRWLDDHRMVSTVTVYPDDEAGEATTEIRILDFDSQEESVIPIAADVIVKRQNSPGGRYLSWLREVQPSDAAYPPQFYLSVYDMDEGRFAVEELDLPDEDRVSWGWIGWEGSRTVVVKGEVEVEWEHNFGPIDWESEEVVPFEVPDRRTPLHHFSLNLDSGRRDHRVSAVKSDQWILSPDYRRAFAVDIWIWAPNRSHVNYMDLTDGTVVPLAKGPSPNWQGDSRFAFRTLMHEGRQWLMRFDAETRTEAPVLTVPTDTVFSGVSPKGRFALFARSRILSIGTYTVVNIASGRRFKIDTRGKSAMLGPAWSPNEQWLILSPYSMETKKVRNMLYHFPEES